MTFPRVLIVAMGRINAADTANNGLLVRNLYGGWPRENLAQIFSSGDNGDAGFFGHYYQLGDQDRRLGSLFYRLKSKSLAGEAEKLSLSELNRDSVSKAFLTKSLIKKLFVESSLYEILFRPRISVEMLGWLDAFRPDIIFAQGYCLTFAWLPVLLARRLSVPIAYYPTDDWPNETYRPDVRFPLLSRLMNSFVSRTARELVERSSVRLAFNRYMLEEYLGRYCREFSVLMHGDNMSRYCGVKPLRSAEADECWIVTTGVFNENRKPLLDDLDRACIELNARGMKVRATVFPVNRLAEFLREPGRYRHIDFAPCPAHDELAAVLRGADILFLPERFDESAKGIRLSVSSKAHLFMFSERPIVVYSDPVTGIARYASEDGWAAVVDRRDPGLLADVFARIISDFGYRQELIDGARYTAVRNHDLTAIRAEFREKITSSVTEKGADKTK